MQTGVDDGFAVPRMQVVGEEQGMRLVVVNTHQGAMIGFVGRHQTIEIGRENNGFKSVIRFDGGLAIGQIVGRKVLEVEVETQLAREVDI